LTQANEIALLACETWDGILSAPQLFMHRENTIFKVQTENGLAALRVHRLGYLSKDAIRSELRWMSQLASQGVMVPQPVVNRQKQLLSEVSHGGNDYIVDLLTWLKGAQLGNSTDPLAYSKVDLQHIFFSLGNTIARIHDVSDAWELPHDFTRHAWDHDGFVGDKAFWGKFWDIGDTHENDRQLLQLAREKASAELQALQRAGADYGLIHADFVRQNILVVGTGVRVIDFDDSGFGFRMYDLATALVKNRNEPHYAAIKFSLIAGYRSLRQLSTLDEQSIELFLTLRDLAYLSWMNARRSEPGVEARMPGIRDATIMAARKFLAAPALN
jgi:Ser/Thr protein kinase RdoA (MazF antagonist)